MHWYIYMVECQFLLVVTAEMDIVGVLTGTDFMTEMARPALGLDVLGLHMIFHVLP